MTVRTVITASGRADLGGTGYAPVGETTLHHFQPNPADAGEKDPLRRELRLALALGDRANNAVVQESEGRWSVQGDPTEGALVVAARKIGLEDAVLDAR